IDTDSAKYIIVFHLTKSSAALRERVLDYLAAAADPSTIDALNEQADDGLVDASIAARLRLGDATVLGILEHRATLSERVSQAVQKYAGVLQAHDLLSATTSRHETVRAIAVNALQKSGNITDTLAFTLTRDTSAQIRSIGYAALLAGGAEIDLDEMTNALGGVDLVEKRMRLVSYYRRLPESALLAKLSFVGTDVAEIYEAIGLQYPANFLDRVRQDLGDRMETFQADWISSFSSTYPPAIAEEIEGGWSAELLSFIRSQFIAAGLRVLARRGQRSDVSSGRAYVNYEDANVRSAAVSVIARFGSAADGPVLAIVADTSYGVLPAAAAAAATKLSGNVEMVLLPLLKAANPTLIRAAIARLRKGRKDRAITVLRGLLRSDKSPTRVLAAAALVEIDRTRAEGFLDEYLEGYRFYDVVCWFDRLLFGPTWLQDAFRRDLNETFGGW
ncbi:MAG TPA: hypothetical protein VNN08_18175, partial [Thermoanaerobaculia bacterium]|nr:hypothetical protein [Thermoanaerobaculia bacterium]